MFDWKLSVLLLSTGGIAFAGEEPGSLLVFPKFDNTEGIVTLLTITNTSKTRGVDVRFDYVDGEDCTKFWREESLTPYDSLCLVTSAHNPQPGRGYVYVHALADNSEPTVFNNLVGTALILDGLTLGSLAYNPCVFKGINNGDVNGNGRRDLDGVEYSPAPGRVVIPRFLGQPDEGTTSNLILIDASGGQGWRSTVELRIFNDNEEEFSELYGFDCWEEVRLPDVSGVFGNTFLRNYTNHDPDEIIGAPGLEAGWFQITGFEAFEPSTGDVIEDPAVLGLLVEPIGFLQASAAPFQVGQRTTGSLQ